MPKPRLDVSQYVGNTYGKAKCISGGVRDGATRFQMECECGNDFEIRGLILNQYIKQGKRLSCGCESANTPKHDGTGTPEYVAWLSMKTRCLNPNSIGYRLYGGRGVTICERWLEPDGQGFINFLADMGKRPSSKHELDKDKLGDGTLYSPDTCCWLEKEENVRLAHQKVTPEDIFLMKTLAPLMSQKSIAEELGLSTRTISRYLDT